MTGRREEATIVGRGGREKIREALGFAVAHHEARDRMNAAANRLDGLLA